jgi:hypothetical protein
VILLLHAGLASRAPRAPASFFSYKGAPDGGDPFP